LKQLGFGQPNRLETINFYLQGEII